MLKIYLSLVKNVSELGRGISMTILLHVIQRQDSNPFNSLRDFPWHSELLREICIFSNVRWQIIAEAKLS